MLRVAASCALLTLVACSGVGGGADAGVDSGRLISALELCDRLATARCELGARCYIAFEREGAGRCKQVEQARCMAGYERLRFAFEAKTVEVNAEQLSLCEERMRTSACVPTFPDRHPSRAAAPFSDCDLETGLLRGRVPSGSTCDDAAECAPGSVCVKPGGVCKGTCSAYPKLSEFCGIGCGPSLWCNDQGNLDPTDDRCAALKGEGTSCATSGQCAPELHCEGTCRRRSRSG